VLLPVLQLLHLLLVLVLVLHVHEAPLRRPLLRPHLHVARHQPTLHLLHARLLRLPPTTVPDHQHMSLMPHAHLLRLSPI
jgi:hypothetical protein